VKIVKSTNCDLGERIIAQVDTHKLNGWIKNTHVVNVRERCASEATG
jgi:hypothetical protein